MGIADLFRPKYRHSDVRVRTEAVKALTSDDAAILEQVARTDRDIGVRRLAIEKIDEADVLAAIAGAESERSLRDFAGERAARLWVSIACSDDDDDAANALTGLIKLGDQQSLVDVAVRAQVPAMRKRAFGEMRDARALSELAKSEAPQDLRIAAVARIDDGDVLRALAIDTTSKEVGLAAVDKIDDRDRLDNVAQKAKNKAVRQRARKIVTEIEEAEKAKKPGVPDEVKRRRAERAQLLREVEAVAESYDFDKASVIVKAAQANWDLLGGDDNDDRFTRTVERFWKRKDIHDTQMRSSQELRVVEREAREDREREQRDRAAAQEAREREQAEQQVPADPAAAAEAKARRDEKDRQRAEEDARRAAQQAEREARKKEDAERSVAIAASLKAMCEDMEQLATSDGGKLDPKAVDRTLQQAAKAFEQIGKVANPDRDQLADRYTAARGKLVVRLSELREAQDWERWNNVPKAEALIQTAKQMAEAPATPDLGNRLRQLQALWKEVGPMPQRRSKELWDLFKQTCDLVYDKVRGVRAVENEKFGDVAKVKEALITEAEGLADSTDFAGTAEKLKALQTQWKASGHLPRKQGDELWKRFRAACDKFFERRKPLVEAKRGEEAANLAKKQSLIARATEIAAKAPADGGWGKSIGAIKDLQREWKEIGFVPRRDADAVYKAFRTACDELFKKRDEDRDGEANAYRAEVDAAKAGIDAVMAGGDDLIARAIAARTKARELGVHAGHVVAMVRHVIETYPDQVAGTELDPSALRARRDKLIGKVAELLPKQRDASAAGTVDIAAQLKNAMRQNAFGDLRFSGRDPHDVIDELRAQWGEAGPLLDESDRAQETKFDDTINRVLETVGPRPSEDDRGGGGGGRDRDGKRRRRDRRSAEQPVQSTAPAHAVIETPTTAEEITALSPVPVATHDQPTTPVSFPPPMTPAPEVPPAGEAAPDPRPERISQQMRARSLSEAPPMDDLDTGWELGDEDPTASPKEAAPGSETHEQTSPSASEMAGDGATEGDGLDTGWD